MSEKDSDNELLPEYDDYTVSSETIVQPEAGKLPTLKQRDHSLPLPLTAENIEAFKDIVRHMIHLDPIDFDNMCTYIQLLLIADVRDNNYTRFLRGVRERFIDPVVTSSTRRYRHTPERIEDLRILLGYFEMIDVDEFMAAFQQGVNQPN